MANSAIGAAATPAALVIVTSSGEAGVVEVVDPGADRLDPAQARRDVGDRRGEVERERGVGVAPTPRARRR